MEKGCQLLFRRTVKSVVIAATVISLLRSGSLTLVFMIQTFYVVIEI